MSALSLEQRHEAAGGHLGWRDCAHAGWIRSELIATEPGRDRLRSWAAAGAPVAVAEGRRRRWGVVGAHEGGQQQAGNSAEEGEFIPGGPQVIGTL